MSRLTFKEVCNFQVDEKYVESDQYGNIFFTVITKPIVTSNQVSFKGLSTDGDQINYLLTNGYEHYGPRLYKEPQYLSKAEVIKALREEKLSV